MPTDHLPDFTALIPTRDRAKELNDCIDSILTQTVRPREILVVDDGPMSEAEAARLKARIEAEGIDWIYLRKDHLDLCRSRNLGIREARCELIAMLDDDTILEPDYFERLRETLIENRGKGVIGTTAVVETKRSVKSPSRMRLALESVFGLHTGRPGNAMASGFCEENEIVSRPEAPPYPVDFPASGACMYWRSALLAAPFAEGYSFVASGDDKWFGLKANRLGKTLFVPRARLFHIKAQGARPNVQRQGEMHICGCYWRMRLLGGGPKEFARFLWGATGWILVPTLGAVAGRRSRNLGFAIGRIRGTYRCIGWHLRGATLEDCVRAAAIRRGDRLDEAVSLDISPNNGARCTVGEAAHSGAGQG